MAQKIPATVITGFLGAGKTTLIRNLLARSNGRRIALIVNEFGDIGVDGEVLIQMNQRQKEVFDVYRLDVETGELTMTGENPGRPAMSSTPFGIQRSSAT